MTASTSPIVYPAARRHVESSYDLIVVGGGLQGALVALEAAARGLRPLLVEARDFGHAASWNTLRTIHRGTGGAPTDYWLPSREAVRQRAWFANQFPDVTRPLQCVLPLYEQGWRRVATLRWMMLASDAMTRLWTRQIESDRGLPSGQMLSARSTRQLFPAVPPRRGVAPLRGAATWYELLVTSPSRLLMELIRWAEVQGAVCLNYMRATELITRQRRVQGVVVWDELGCQQLTFRAPLVFNCSGPRASWTLVDGLPPVPDRKWSLAFNVLLHREAVSPAALVITPTADPSEHQRHRKSPWSYFMVPRHGRVVVGTAYCSLSDELSADPPRVSEARLDELLAVLGSTGVPGILENLSLYDVAQVQSGLVPAPRAGAEEGVRWAKPVYHTESDLRAGLVSLTPASHTSARAMAELALSELWPRRPAKPIPAPAVADSAINLHAWRPPSAMNLEAWVAELHRMIQAEQVHSWEDFVLRRTDWSQQFDAWWSLIPRIVELAAQVGRPIHLPRRIDGQGRHDPPSLHGELSAGEAI